MALEKTLKDVGTTKVAGEITRLPFITVLWTRDALELGMFGGVLFPQDGVEQLDKRCEVFNYHIN